MEKQHYYWKRVMSETEARNHWKQLDLNKGKVLDLGCGKGLFGKYAPAGVDMYGLDIDSGAVKEAKKIYKNAKVADLNKKLPFGSNFFDAIFAKDVFEHLIEPWKLAAECSRVLKKGGKIIAVVPSPSAKAWDDYTHVRPFTKRSIEELFLDNGFEIEHIKRTRGIIGFGKLGLSPYVHYFLEIPIFRWLTHGFEVKAVKK